MALSRTIRRAGLVTVAAAEALAAVGLGVRRFVDSRVRMARRYEVRRLAPSVVQACGHRDAADKMTCYRQAFAERLAAGGVADAVATLELVAAVDPDVARDGHVYAHGLGIDAYGRFHDVAGPFLACGNELASGCRHGVIQAYLEARQHVSAADLNALCRPFESRLTSNWLLYQCLHGLGHGITMFYDHDLPRALGSCDSLAGAWERESCYSGAFMESIVNATAPHHPASELAAGMHHHTGVAFQALDPADPLYPCSIMARRYLYACYLVQTAAILQLNHGDIAAAARTCDRAPPKLLRVCYQSLGRDITSFVNRNTRETTRLCALASATGRPWCYAGAVKSIVDWTATTDSGFAFCRGLGPDPGRDTCYRALGEQVGALIWSGPERALQCERAGDRETVAACRVGAGVRRR